MKNLKTVLVFAIVAAFFLTSCEDSGSKNSTLTSDADAFIIKSKSVGQIKLGQAIDSIHPATSQKLTHEIVKYTSEDGDMDEETVYTLSDNGVAVFKITGDTEANIDVISVISDKYKTSNGIGIGSSINDFSKAYPDFKILYSYLIGYAWIETASLDAQFKVDIKNFTGTEDKLTGNDLVELNIKEFQTDTKIFEIRVFAK